jgi:DNA mismatch repair protein MutL
MPIKILPEETINKIAAGEVVERPANAAKELIENSLDAKSTSIEIEIKETGKKLLRVRDNGSGIAAGEMKLAVTRHATSKIADFNDLEQLNSMGFRGEALPSIAAVSKMLIQSQTAGSSSGWEISLDGGKTKHEAAWAGAPGTNIEITDLFYNTPVRAKFQKSETTERHRILQIIEELALVNNTVSFKVKTDKRTALEAPATNNPLERIADILGSEFSSSLMPVKLNHPFLNISAYITKRENSQPTKKFQFLFVNRRPVNFTRSLLHSLYEAYRENLPAGRHPGAVIFLETSPSDIDVNIHPTKREVRFAKEAQIHDLLYKAFKEALINAPVTGLNVSYRETEPTFAEKNYTSREPSPGSSYAESVARSGILARPKNNTASQVEFASTTEHEAQAPRKILCQLYNLYVVAQDADGLLIIDQHAAAERIRYEKYRAEWEAKKIVVQPLLFPENIELAPSLWTTAASNMELLKEAGWEIEEFGQKTIRISAVPAALGANVSAKTVFQEMLEAILNQTNLPGPEKIEKIIRAACLASIKAGDTISAQEASRLIEELLLCKAPNTCPHGRPTMIKLSKTELGKHFSRQ